MCAECLALFAKRMCRPPLKFDVEESGSRVSFVHLDVIGTWNGLGLSRNDKNKPFLCGWEAKPVKVRYPPYLGPSLLRIPKMRSWIRAAWFADLCTEDGQLRSLGAVRIVAELALLGYPVRVLQRVVGGITQQPVRALRGTALRYLRALRKAHANFPLPRPCETTCMRCMCSRKLICTLLLLTPHGRVFPTTFLVATWCMYVAIWACRCHPLGFVS